MKYYVYLLKEGDEPIYVGKGTGRRMYEHRNKAMTTNRNTPLYNRIRKIVREGNNIAYEIVFQTNDVTIAFDKEKQLIKFYGRKDQDNGSLLNLTDGGEGAINYIFPEERKKSLSEKIKRAIVEGRYDPAKNRAKLDQTDPIYRAKKSLQRKLWFQTETGKAFLKRLSILKKSKLIDGKRTDLTDDGRRRLSVARSNANKSKHNTSRGEE